MQSRRQMLKTCGAALMGISLPLSGCTTSSSPRQKASKKPFRIALNTSTISGYQLHVEQQIDICAEAGYEGIELWVKDVRAFEQRGGTAEQLGERVKDAGLILENLIGFAPWMVDEDGMQAMKQEMELCARLGSKHIAATCFGRHTEPFSLGELPRFIALYRELIDYGSQIGVRPLLELWGHRMLNQLSDVMAIALGSGRSQASLLLDFYHLYRGNNDYQSLSLINGAALPVFHINDYPASIAREQLKDTDRIFPGDGACPFREVLPILYQAGFRGALSLELFHEPYWQQYEVKELLRIGKEKVAAVIDQLHYS